MGNLLQALSRGDAALLWALRRKLAKELSYDERGKPGLRRKLKAAKRIQQSGKCTVCSKPLSDKYSVLDRLETMAGYNVANTRLICHECDKFVQRQREYR